MWVPLVSSTVLQFELVDPMANGNHPNILLKFSSINNKLTVNVRPCKVGAILAQFTQIRTFL